jgi:hypothetical protein
MTNSSGKRGRPVSYDEEDGYSWEEDNWETDASSSDDGPNCNVGSSSNHNPSAPRGGAAGGVAAGDGANRGFTIDLTAPDDEVSGDGDGGSGDEEEVSDAYSGDDEEASSDGGFDDEEEAVSGDEEEAVSGDEEEAVAGGSSGNVPREHPFASALRSLKQIGAAQWRAAGFGAGATADRYNASTVED